MVGHGKDFGVRDGWDAVGGGDGDLSGVSPGDGFGDDYRLERRVAMCRGSGEVRGGWDQS